MLDAAQPIEMPARFRGAKLALRPMHVWALRVRLQIARRVRDLALFDTARMHCSGRESSYSRGVINRTYASRWHTRPGK